MIRIFQTYMENNNSEYSIDYIEDTDKQKIILYLKRN
jgi:hypothetical protein